MILQEILLVFLIGSFFGWVFETIRAGIVNRRFTNRGFLRGIYLPIYGFGAIFVLLISYFNLNLFYRSLFFVVSLTLLEFVVGIFFLKRGVRLWEYDWGFNYKKIISVYSSLLWLALALFFYFFVFNDFREITKVLFEHLTIRVFVVLVYATILIDSVTRIRRLFSKSPKSS